MDTLTLDAGTKDLTKNINTLMNVKKLSKKNKKRVSPETKALFSDIIYQKEKRNIDRQRSDTNVG